MKARIVRQDTKVYIVERWFWTWWIIWKSDSATDEQALQVFNDLKEGKDTTKVIHEENIQIKW